MNMSLISDEIWFETIISRKCKYNKGQNLWHQKTLTVSGFILIYISYAKSTFGPDAAFCVHIFINHQRNLRHPGYCGTCFVLEILSSNDLHHNGTLNNVVILYNNLQENPERQNIRLAIAINSHATSVDGLSSPNCALPPQVTYSRVRTRTEIKCNQFYQVYQPENFLTWTQYLQLINWELSSPTQAVKWDIRHCFVVSSNTPLLKAAHLPGFISRPSTLLPLL